MKKIPKTNAMRYLDDLHIAYEIFQYDIDDGKIDGISVSKKIGYPVEVVYKTLILSGENIYVMILPVDKEIDLKSFAKVVGEKKVEMIPVKEILSLTGYIRGGCSPFAMKKNYPTYIQEDILLQEYIVISAGKIGLQIKVNVDDFLQASKANLVDVIIG